MTRTMYLLAGHVVQVVEHKGLNDLILQTSHHIALGITPFKEDTFPCETNEQSSDSGKIANENMYYSAGPEESMDLCEVLALQPVPNLLDFGLMWNMAAENTLVTNNSSIGGGEQKFLGRDHCIDILQALEDPMDNGQMVPNE